MTSPLLVKGQAQGRCIVEVTPERAGWKHVGFEAMRLARAIAPQEVAPRILERSVSHLPRSFTGCQRRS